jgi:DNA-binding beta-propeller fold protein YncE
VVTGSSYGVGTLQDYATVAYDAVNGDRRWVARYNDSGNGDDAATSLALSPDGSKVFVTGRSEPQPHSSANFVTVAYDVDNGRQLWIARDERSGGGARSVVVSPDGTKVFVTGSVGSDYGTIAYDATNGSELWFARYNGPLNDGDGAAKITISPDGTTVYVSGSSAGSNAYADYATVAYNATDGAQKWVARYNGPGDSADDVTGLGVSPDGTKVFVTGRSYGSTTSLDYATVAYSAATGTQQWASRYNGAANSDDGAYGLGVSPDGTQVFVTGYSFDQPNNNGFGFAAATVAYNAVTGTQQWGARYNGPAKNALALSLAVSPDGTNVFVIGSTSGGTATGWDYATVAYNTAVGTQQWAARYNGPTNTSDNGSAIAVSLDAKKVFVTGFTHEFIDEGFPPPTSPPPGPSQDYATVAYDAS